MTRGMPGAVVSSVLLWASIGSATITQVSSPQGLVGGPFTVENFEDGALQPGATYTAPGGVSRAAAVGAVGGVTPSGNHGLVTSAVSQEITITFAQPVASAGLWIGNDDTCCSTGTVASMDIYESSNLVGTISIVANMNDYCDQFLGFNSDQQVTRVVVRFGATAPEVGMIPYIDDVYFNTIAGCAPTASSGCRTASKSLLLVEPGRLVWKWIKGASTTQAEFSDPMTSADYSLCIYAGTASSLIGQAFLAASGSTWSATTHKGYNYRDPTAQAGITKAILRGSHRDASRIVMTGKGHALPNLPFGSIQAPVAVQFVNGDNGLCWGTDYGSSSIVKNGFSRLEARVH